MADRLDLQTLFEELLESENVYFDPPESKRMEYPAIRYSRAKIVNRFANDSVYNQNNRYEVIAIYRDPDSDIPVKISRLPMCSHETHYVVDNLHHDRFTLYF
jgi:hypothetical protein